MKTDDFDYILPSELIAQTPPETRTASRLLMVSEAKSKTPFEDHTFADFIDCCAAGDLLVLNDTRVVPARLRCQKASGGQVEVMLERLLPDAQLLALARSNKTLKPGTLLYIDGQAELEFIGREGEFFRLKLLSEAANQYDVFHRCGDIPLPPYIKRNTDQQDLNRYQTVYAQ
ncbi:MAG: S-adenosylmethionine:tRNA ribosyltransferase-isomerase, partial [Arenicellales bacterium]